MRGKYLFKKFDAFGIKEVHKRKLIKELTNLAEGQVRGTKLDKWIDYFTDKYFLDVPIIYREGINLEVNDVKLDPRKYSRRYMYDDFRGRDYVEIDGTQIILTIPYSGDKDLFDCSGNSIMHNSVEAYIGKENLSIEYNLHEPTSEKINQQVEKDVNFIEGFLNGIRNSVKEFNDSITGIVESQINQRLEKFNNDNDLKSKLNFPLKQRGNAPKTFVTPNVRKKIKASMPSPEPRTKFEKPDPEISIEDYNDILKICHSMTLVMKKSPHAFKTMGEEDIRHQFLVQLNGQYHGNASGETFNFEGRTDILISEDSKNLFIGECKFWKGPKTIHETIDQLQGYSTWRDTKTAIFLFNRNKNFSNVLSKISEQVESHENFVSKEKSVIDSETEFRYIFKQPKDHNRKMFITFMIFDVPA